MDCFVAALGGIVRGQHDAWMDPERAVRRQRFLGEDIERGGAEGAVVKTGEKIVFVLKTAAAGIDQDRRAHRARAVQCLEHIAVENVPRLLRQRQQANQDIGPPKERREAAIAGKAFDAFDASFASAPAGDAETDAPQDIGRIGAKHAQSHQADRDRVRRPLVFGRPAFLALRLAQV
jgi:hypothetical protein